jgi:hypothetical protein
MIVDPASGPAPVAAIRSQIVTGRNGGDWLGNGITSSAAAASQATSDKTAVGYATQASLGTTVFQGQTIDADTVVVLHTLNGDTNLDKAVGGSDFNVLASNFGQAGTFEWYQGDFDFNTAVDSADFNLLASNFGKVLPGDGEGTGTIIDPITPGHGDGSSIAQSVSLPTFAAMAGPEAVAATTQLQQGVEAAAAPGTGGPGGAVPEPGSLMVLGLGAMGLLARRRRA